MGMLRSFFINRLVLPRVGISDASPCTVYAASERITVIRMGFRFRGFPFGALHTS